MNTLKQLGLCAAVSALPGVAGAADLKILEVAAAQISCAFLPACAAINPETFQDFIALPGMTGIANLRSQTFTGQSGTPAEGKTGYQYRVDMTRAAAVGDYACVTDLHVNFGAATPLRYDPAGPAGDVFVISKGGLGTIGLASAVQSGNVITFTFEQPVCAATASSPGQVSSVFGLTGSAAPMFLTVKAGMPGIDHVDVKAMVPTR